jgi:hypothetical protein
MPYALQLTILVAFVLAVAASTPLIHWLAGRSRSVTSVAGGAAGFVVLVALALVLGPQPLFRAALLWSLAGGGLAALALSGRRSRIEDLSIRPH